MSANPPTLLEANTHLEGEEEEEEEEERNAAPVSRAAVVPPLIKSHHNHPLPTPTTAEAEEVEEVATPIAAVEAVEVFREEEEEEEEAAAAATPLKTPLPHQIRLQNQSNRVHHPRSLQVGPGCVCAVLAIHSMNCMTATASNRKVTMKSLLC